VDPSKLRIGLGYDLHALEPGRPLVIAGVVVPFDRGPRAHSDGDVVFHAVLDACLSGAGLDDLGTLFSDRDPRWRGASGATLAREVCAQLRQSRFRILDIDAVILLEQPRVAPLRGAMRQNLAAALEIDAEQVRLKGKSGEGLDAVGRGEAIACHAVALMIGA
jgi:2-C-methyl-D-erythritol 2,4-cyclodiphosphate synthase